MGDRTPHHKALGEKDGDILKFFLLSLIKLAFAFAEQLWNEVSPMNDLRDQR